MKQYFIYMTTNLINDMKYIGKHYGEVNDGYLGSGKILRFAVKKYGKKNFSRDILAFSNSEEENCEKEKYFIALYDATQNPFFYNIHEGGEGGNTTAGYTEEQKRELRQKMSRLQTGENNGMYGKHHSEKTKEYLSFWATYYRDNSVYQTPEFRAKMSAVTKGSNNGMYGKTHSEETKEQISQKLKGKLVGPKNGMYGKTGDDALNGKYIAMIDKDGIEKYIFHSKKSALDFLGVKGHIGLNKAIKNHSLYKGYYWEERPKDI